MVKKLFLLIVLLSYCHFVNSQTFTSIWKTKSPAVSADTQFDALGQEIYIENLDFCPYTSRDGDVVAQPGKHMDRRDFKYSYSQADAQYTRSRDFNFGSEVRAIQLGKMFRGVVVDSAHIANLYSCPLKPKTETTVHFEDGDKKHVRFTTNKGDTIYAVRGGVVCLSGSSYGLIVYHKDYSFCVYRCFQETYVKPGDKVEVGKPLGLALNDYFSLHFLFLDKKKILPVNESSDIYTYFLPNLQMEESVLSTPRDTTLIVPSISHKVIMLDMSKSDRKKYKKAYGIK